MHLNQLNGGHKCAHNLDTNDLCFMKQDQTNANLAANHSVQNNQKRGLMKQILMAI